MQHVKAQLSVFFEEPFWIGVYERMEDHRIEASKIVFGSEPKDQEVYSFLNDHWNHLKFSPPIPGEELAERKINPKRMQREIARELQTPGIGTKAQQALKALQEENKAERKLKSKQKREEERDRQFELRQKKKKEKHKGR